MSKFESLVFTIFKPFQALALFILFWCPLLTSPANAQFQRALGIDGTGMRQPMPAFAVAVPKGWQPKGGVVWGNQSTCNRYGYDMSWAAVSPDQRYGVAILPSVRWTNSAQSGLQGCSVLQIGSAQDAISTLVSQRR
ncbi:hypothetical protein [Ruegeria sp. ANG-R]|uniref:hypothetical protein n=1 Tax=Ruegeria sp. ANG-R TaxID=1577903 RepID=UPI001269D911|nr:hypothetical protein [Ruegeria sp. ANG-R]